MPSEYVQISLGVLALLGYATKQFVPYFMRKLDERDETINGMHTEFRVMTEKFTETINHKTTAWTEAVEKQTAAIEAQTEIFSAMLRGQKTRRK